MNEGEPPAKPTRLEPLSLCWRFFAAPPTLILLLGLVALTLVLGGLIPQLPPEAAEDPQAWLAVEAAAFGPAAGPISALGLYHVYHSFGFYLLLVLTGLALFVWTLESADLALHAARRESWTPAAFAHWGRHAPRLELASSWPVQDTEVRLCDMLAQDGYLCTQVHGLPAVNLVASRRRLALWSEPLVYSALLAALVGLAISSIWGWQSADWQPVPGESRSVGHGTPYAVRLDAFELQQELDGRLRQYQSTITWLEDEADAGQRVLLPGRATTRHGVAARQVGYSPVVTLRGRDDAGHALLFQAEGEEPMASGEVHIAFPVPSAQPLILVYGRNVVLALAFEPLSKEGKPTLRVALLDEAGGVQKPLAALHNDGTVSINGLQLAIKLDYRPVLRVDYRPMMGLVVMGAALAVLALAIRWLIPPRLLWIVLRASPAEYFVSEQEGAARFLGGGGPSGEGERRPGPLGCTQDALEDSTVVHILPLPWARASQWPRKLASRLRVLCRAEAEPKELHGDE